MELWMRAGAEAALSGQMARKTRRCVNWVLDGAYPAQWT